MVSDDRDIQFLGISKRDEGQEMRSDDTDILYKHDLVTAHNPIPFSIPSVHDKGV